MEQKKGDKVIMGKDERIKRNGAGAYTGALSIRLVASH
jgi:hypothetical protein